MLINFQTAKYVSTIFSLGFVGKMPGTLGSLVGLLFGIILNFFLDKKIAFAILILSTIIFTLCVYVYQKKAGKIDKSEIIIDEFLGQQIPLVFLDLTFLNICLSFILFRFFDIFKIFPCNYIDKRYSGCIGVMLDDIIAAIQAFALILFINYYVI
tara:strand:+ start:197 stop:661 length:465 start_codon:yes stop_codon:yes gene_type:complete